MRLVRLPKSFLVALEVNTQLLNRSSEFRLILYITRRGLQGSYISYISTIIAVASTLSTPTALRASLNQPASRLLTLLPTISAPRSDSSIRTANRRSADISNSSFGTKGSSLKLSYLKHKLRTVLPNVLEG